jgi:hypothetical protein
LLRATRDILLNLGCLPTSAKFKVILNKKEDIRRFITVVGTGNPRTKEKFKKFLEN